MRALHMSTPLKFFNGPIQHRFKLLENLIYSKPWNSLSVSHVILPRGLGPRDLCPNLESFPLGVGMLDIVSGAKSPHQRKKSRQQLMERSRSCSMLYKKTLDCSTTQQWRIELSMCSEEKLGRISLIPMIWMTTIEIKSWFRRHLKLELSLVDISNASTIGGLAKVTINVLRAKYQAGGPETNGSQARSSENDAQHLQDLVLGRDFRPIPGPVPEWHSESEGHILLTGATGFMGAFLLSMLTTLPKLQSVTCLIRAPSHTAAMTRLDKAFEKFNLPKNFQDKVRAVPGDTSQQYLGLDSADFDQLVEKCSAIFHLGAAVNYSQPYASLRDVNVLGTVNVLAFANTRRLKSVHYFSGLAAYGPASFMGGQKSVPENERPVAGSGQLQHHQGYPLAKSVAESICWDVIANGFPLTIYRPGFVLGHSVTGVGNSDDAVHQLMSTCIRLGLYPHPPDQRNFFVPVDFVCSAAMHISLSNENIGQAYNLIHPDPDQNISLSDTFSIVSQLTSPPLRGVPFSEWVGAISGAKAYPLSQIAPILASRETEYAFWLDSKNEGMVAYGTENLHRALANRPDILECKGMSSLLELYFQQWSQ